MAKYLTDKIDVVVREDAEIEIVNGGIKVVVVDLVTKKQSVIIINPNFLTKASVAYREAIESLTK